MSTVEISYSDFMLSSKSNDDAGYDADDDGHDEYAGKNDKGC